MEVLYLSRTLLYVLGEERCAPHLLFGEWMSDFRSGDLIELVAVGCAFRRDSARTRARSQCFPPEKSRMRKEAPTLQLESMGNVQMLGQSDSDLLLRCGLVNH